MNFVVQGCQKLGFSNDCDIKFYTNSNGIISNFLSSKLLELLQFKLEIFIIFIIKLYEIGQKKHNP